MLPAPSRQLLDRRKTETKTQQQHQQHQQLQHQHQHQHQQRDALLAEDGDALNEDSDMTDVGGFFDQKATTAVWQSMCFVWFGLWIGLLLFTSGFFPAALARPGSATMEQQVLPAQARVREQLKSMLELSLNASRTTSTKLTHDYPDGHEHESEAVQRAILQDLIAEFASNTDDSALPMIPSATAGCDAEAMKPGSSGDVPEKKTKGKRRPIAGRARAAESAEHDKTRDLSPPETLDRADWVRLLQQHMTVAEATTPSFDKAVIILVDALRADFLFESVARASSVVDSPRRNGRAGFPFVHSLADAGVSLPFVARAHAPTVTLPRLKALLSGTVPTFVDFALNFNSPKLEEDNLIHQLSGVDVSGNVKAGARARNLMLYGDDTWLKMFPEHESTPPFSAETMSNGCRADEGFSCSPAVSAVNASRGVWMKSDGVSSFFVQDTTEVDFNVTRHLDAALFLENRTDDQDPDFDWDILILHYLGLDHVGHSDGPTSSLMGPKQREMDKVVQQVFEALSVRDSYSNRTGRSLLLLVSDHGMNSAGNHGGSMSDETRAVALLFHTDLASRRRSSDRSALLLTSIKQVEQIDLCPTLATLFGVPVPQNSMGSFIGSVANWSLQLGSDFKTSLRLLNGVARVSHQLLLLAVERNAAIQPYSIMLDRAAAAHASCLVSLSQQFARENADVFSLSDCIVRAIKEYESACDAIQQDLTGDVLSYITWRLWTGVGLLACCAMFANTLCCLGLLHRFHLWKSSGPAAETSSTLWVFSWVLFAVHVISLSSSSFVEEEQQTWYAIAPTLLCGLFLSVLRSSSSTSCDASLSKRAATSILSYSAIALVSLRFARTMNQTGNKWLDLPDTGDWLSESGNEYMLLLCVCISLVIVLPALRDRILFLPRRNLRAFDVVLLFSASFLLLAKLGRIFRTTNVLPFAFAQMADLAMVYRIEFERTVFLGLAGAAGELVRTRNRQNATELCNDAIACISVLLVLLHRPHNAVLVACFGYVIPRAVITVFSSLKLVANDQVTVMVNIWAMFLLVVLGRVSYFAFGNSNSLASFDISGAYTGLRKYHELIVGLNSILIAASGPLLSLSHQVYFLSQLMQRPKFTKAVVTWTCASLLAWRGFELGAFAAVATAMRFHLFVWSVFSPKLLFEVMWAMWDFITVCVLFAVARSASCRQTESRKTTSIRA